MSVWPLCLSVRGERERGPLLVSVRKVREREREGGPVASGLSLSAGERERGALPVSVRKVASVALLCIAKIVHTLTPSDEHTAFTQAASKMHASSHASRPPSSHANCPHVAIARARYL